MTANRRRHLACAALAAVAIACASARVRADTSSSNQTLAQTLFDEAVKLMDQGRFGEACPKLAESQRLDPGGGTLLCMGFCRQNEGKFASAWAAYNEALSQAIHDGRKDREATARQHVAELDGKVAKLAIDLSDAAKAVEQIEIRLDGTPVRQAAWGVLSPIDRGEHTIVVTAPGKREFRTSIDVTIDGSVQRTSIPALADAPVVVVTPNPDRGVERHGLAGQALVGWVTAGVGIALLGVGGATGALAIDARQKSNAECPNNECTQRGVDFNEQAKTFAWFADFGVGLGVAAVATGVILVLAAPKSTARITPVVGMRSAGLTFSF